jgi:hypothetical protein
VLYQLLVVEWLAQETYRAGLKSSPTDLFLWKRYDEYHWCGVAPRDRPLSCHFKPLRGVNDVMAKHGRKQRIKSACD